MCLTMHEAVLRHTWNPLRVRCRRDRLLKEHIEGDSFIGCQEYYAVLRAGLRSSKRAQ